MAREESEESEESAVTNPVSDELVGVWVRESLQVEDDPPFEDSQVVWLQARNWFADVRVALPGEKAPSESFGGNVEWREPHLRFNHSIDLTGNFSDDKGKLSFDGDVLIEEGSVDVGDKTIRYSERWLRKSSLNPSYAVLCANDGEELQGLIVRVDEHMIAMTRMAEFVSGYFRLGATAERGWGVGVFDAPDLPKSLGLDQTTELLGVSYRCVEVS